MHLTSIMGVSISLTHILSRSYKLWEIGDACISPVSVASHTPLPTAFIVSQDGTEDAVHHTACGSFYDSGKCVFLSEFALQKTIHLLSNLCFCLTRPVFPITLSLPKYLSDLSGISGGS